MCLFCCCLLAFFFALFQLILCGYVWSLQLSDNKPERGSCDNTDDEKEEAEELANEANMSLPELMAKYGEAFDNEEDGEDTDKTRQAKKHLKALAQKVGYSIDFGLDDDEEEADQEDGEGKEKKEGESEASEAAGQCNGSEAESSGGRRGRKARKPSKAQAGPVNVSPSDDTAAATAKEAGSNKATPGKDSKVPEAEEERAGEGDVEEDSDEDSSDSDYQQAEKESSDDDDEDEDDDDNDEEDGEKDEEVEEDADEDDDNDEDSEEEEDNMEDSIVSGEMDDEEDFPVGVGKSSGSTAVAALLVDDQLIVANTGDSRCVLCRNGTAVAMSEDHQPENEEERKRIERAGGTVSEYGRVNNGLNMSRAIGK